MKIKCLFAKGFEKNLGVSFLLSSFISILAFPSVGATTQDAGSEIVPEHAIKPAAKFYVSKAGDNSDGLTWKTAWNELDQIKWKNVATAKADTVQIFIDGGNRSMAYHKALRMLLPYGIGTPAGGGGSINNGKNYVVSRSREVGHSGQIIIDGQDKLNTGMVLGIPNTRINGITWRGIKVCGFERCGVRVLATPVVLSGVEIEGDQKRQPARLRPNGDTGPLATMPSFGVLASGEGNINLSGVIVHDTMYNLRFTGPIKAFVHKCWVYSSAYMPKNSNQERVTGVASGYHGEVFAIAEPSAESAEEANLANAANNAALISKPTSTRIVDSVIGPGLGIGAMSAFTSNLLASNCLMLNASNANFTRPEVVSSLNINSYGSLRIDNVTSFMTNLNYEDHVHDYIRSNSPDPDASVNDSIVYGGHIRLKSSARIGQNNFQYKTTGNTVAISSRQIDPKFRTNVGLIANDVNLRTLMLADFSLASGSPAHNSGSRLTSVRQLLNSPLP